MFRLIIKYIKYLFISGHRKGRGIHSPYAFSFVNDVIFDRGKFTAPQELVVAHRSLFKNRDLIRVKDFGAGSKTDNSLNRTVRSITRWSSVNPKNGRLLYRIAGWTKPSLILELGTGLGISTAYLASGCPDARVVTIEGSEGKSEFARDFLTGLNIQNVNIHTGQFDEILPGLLDKMNERMLVFMDGNHRYEPTMKYFSQLLKCGADELMIIMDDIHWSKGMEKAWREIKEMEEVRVTLDLFYHGILILDSNLNKEDFVVKI